MQGALLGRLQGHPVSALADRPGVPAMTFCGVAWSTPPGGSSSKDTWLDGGAEHEGQVGSGLADVRETSDGIAASPHGPWQVRAFIGRQAQVGLAIGWMPIRRVASLPVHQAQDAVGQNGAAT